jgi:hypothetical protein
LTTRQGTVAGVAKPPLSNQGGYSHQLFEMRIVMSKATLISAKKYRRIDPGEAQ